MLFVTRKRRPPIICGKYERSGVEDERYLHSLASTAEAVFSDQNPDPFIVGATCFVFGIIGLRLWTIVPKSRRWKLSAISGAGGHRDGSTVPRSIFWHRDYLGSAVWVLKGN